MATSVLDQIDQNADGEMIQANQEPIQKLFWDIESYDNLFICGILDEQNHLDMFYQVNVGDDAAVAEIERACRDSGYDYTCYDLSHDISKLRAHFEKRVPTNAKNSLLADFLGETDQPVKARTQHYFGYNTLHYDIPMIDHIINSAVANRLQTTPTSIREYSDRLIGPNAPYFNTLEYEMYANQIDCAFLNEKMVDKGHPIVGLKTLVGIKGGSIIESDSNNAGHSDHIYYDVLYNINDIVELRDVVFPGVMELTFQNRETLLNTFPSLRAHNITPNSTSAKFVEFIIAPDEPINDPKVVDFMYPAKHIAQKLKVPQVDMLESTKQWYLKNVYQVVAQHDANLANLHLVNFMFIYQFYATLRDQNWNTSPRHMEQFNNPANGKDKRKELLDTFPTFMPLIDDHGQENGTYVNFSIGGIHGAEINQKQLEQDRALIAELKAKYKYISKIPKQTVAPKLMNLIINQSRSCVNDYPQRFSHEVPAFYKQTHPVDEIVDPLQFTPFIYDGSKNKHKEVLIDRYKYTSIGNVVHQDFDGYYVRLLINSGAFYDGHGKDPYDQIYQFRLNLKAKLKHFKFGTTKYERADVQQKGYKLVLNSASGLLDASFDTNVRANNKAIGMRAIGQMITFRITMALCMHGAKAPSTNTDGVYVSNIDLDENKRIVAEELKPLYLVITPEPLYLVSKDTNNRMESVDGHIEAAAGASLSAFEGAKVEKSLAHPAIIDKLMTLYLQHPTVLDGNVDTNLIQKLLDQYYHDPQILDAFKDYDDAKERTVVYMAAWVMRSTSGSIMIDDHDTVYPGTIRTWLTNTGLQLQKYNVNKQQIGKSLDQFADYLMGDSPLGKPEILQALSQADALKQLKPAITVREYQQLRKLMQSNHQLTREEVDGAPQAFQDLYQRQQRGQNVDKLSVDVVKQSKITNLPDDAHVMIDNHSILKMDHATIHQIYQGLNLAAYAKIVATFAAKWQNPVLPSRYQKQTKIK